MELVIISLKINLFSPYYSWKIAELALKNNHSLTQYFYRTWLYIWVTWLVSYKTAYPSRASEFIPGFFGGIRVAHLFSFLCCPVMCHYVLRSVLCCPFRFRHKQCSVRLFLQLFVGWLMSYLRVIVCCPTHVVFLFCFSESCVPYVASFSESCVPYVASFSESCVPYVASFSGLSIFHCSVGVL